MLVASAGAQSELAPHLQKITVPVQDGGVYDISTGTWASSALTPPIRDVIYDNTCDPGYFSTAPAGYVLVDEGRVPGPSIPVPSTCQPGCATSYTVNAFEIAYCTYNTTPQAVIGFDNHYRACDGSTMFDPLVASFVLTGLPGSPEAGVLSCWTVTVDLGSQAFVLAADGGTASPSNRFGWSIEFTTSQNTEGPLFAGNYEHSCPECGGTVWDPVGQNASPAGTGLSTSEAYLVFFPSGSTYCFAKPFFHSLWLELQSDEACPPEPGMPSCFGTTALCPCGNDGYVDTGCDNAQGTGGVRLRAFDFTPNGLGGGTARLEGSNFPFFTSPSAIVIRSPSVEGQPVVFGDGLRCIGLAGLVRLGATAASGGISNHFVNHGAGSGTFHYQIWYRNQPASLCDASAAFNLSSAYALTW